MSLSLGGSKQKSRQEEATTQTYTPNAGFVSGVNNLLGQASGMSYQPTTQANIDAMANPYLAQVGENTSSQIMRSRDITGNNLDAQAAKAGAFGGSGWGLLRGESNRGYADAEATALANINAQGYESSRNAAMSENQNANQFNLSNLLAQLQGYGLLNYGTTSGTGLTKSSGSGMNASAGFKYGG
jgi:hypothetical protein